MVYKSDILIDTLFQDFSDSRESSPNPDVCSIHSTPLALLKHARSSSFLESPDEHPAKHKGRISGPTAVADVASAMRELASSFVSSSSTPSTPEHLVKAIWVAEKDDELDDSEKLRLIILFQKDISYADTYLAFDKKTLHMAFVCSAI